MFITLRSDDDNVEDLKLEAEFVPQIGSYITAFRSPDPMANNNLVEGRVRNVEWIIFPHATAIIIHLEQ